MAYPFGRQPLKGLYLFYQFITTVFIRVPLWVVLNIPRYVSYSALQSILLISYHSSSWRPRKTWTLKRTILLKLIKHLMGMISRYSPVAIIVELFF